MLTTSKQGITLSGVNYAQLCPTYRVGVTYLGIHTDVRSPALSSPKFESPIRHDLWVHSAKAAGDALTVSSYRL